MAFTVGKTEVIQGCASPGPYLKNYTTEFEFLSLSAPYESLLYYEFVPGYRG